jgi:hypothetical protein
MIFNSVIFGLCTCCRSGFFGLIGRFVVFYFLGRLSLSIH